MTMSNECHQYLLPPTPSSVEQEYRAPSLRPLAVLKFCVSVLTDLVTLGLVLMPDLKKLEKRIQKEDFYYFLGSLGHVSFLLMARMIGSYKDIHLTWFIIASNNESNHT